MKYLLTATLMLSLYGCANQPAQKTSVPTETVTPPVSSCIGNVDLPANLQDQFETTEDPALLAESLGAPNQGKLCQGQVYQSKADTEITLFRAWNSTNPHSQLGKWWAFSIPAGKVATYRSDFEICYQWSPLDKLVHCKLKPGTKVVVGTGQSAECSQFLTYPVSAKQQIYLNNASETLSECQVLDGEFSWK